MNHSGAHSGDQIFSTFRRTFYTSGFSKTKQFNFGFSYHLLALGRTIYHHSTSSKELFKLCWFVDCVWNHSFGGHAVITSHQTARLHRCSKAAILKNIYSHYLIIWLINMLLCYYVFIDFVRFQSISPHFIIKCHKHISCTIHKQHYHIYHSLSETPWSVYYTVKKSTRKSSQSRRNNHTKNQSISDPVIPLSSWFSPISAISCNQRCERWIQRLS